MRFGEMHNAYNEAVYTATYCLYKPLARVAFGLQVFGRENIPQEGAALVASNHRTFLDTLALPYAVRDRHLSMIARDDFSSGRFMQWFFDHGEVIQIKRGNFSRDNLRAIDERIDEERLVGIYPEETRGDRELRKTDPRANLGPFKPGTAFFAKRHNIPTVPAAVSGLDNPTKKGQRRIARAVFGEPIEPPKGGSTSKEAFLTELRLRIEDLYEAHPAIHPEE
ncbi:hypothetical protein A3E49_03865 [Candidatus Saccharibacteria bacterium RIFCSPHIGHO2_12_FULL_49_19]|nr:MAG: hypothetical protein A3E49_03865 [Candidatus Saccharibacteria bacterium RIFCSPHIGHO2_12_FULL_49_19]OGL37664.1 MAG: hypothetical protein A3B63_03030 [Candidatus Saccharibacteria bacterium RIFCSPLOWO2_01_FULL_49_22]